MADKMRPSYLLGSRKHCPHEDNEQQNMVAVFIVGDEQQKIETDKGKSPTGMTAREGMSHWNALWYRIKNTNIGLSPAKQFQIPRRVYVRNALEPAYE